MAVLDNPVWHALTTRHAHLAEGSGSVRRYRDGVSVFWAVDHPGPAAWAAIAAQAPPGATPVIIGPADDPTPDWPIQFQLDGYQMVLDELVEVAVPADVRRLGPDDVAAMVELVALTRPGPFLAGTIAMGDYHGVVRDGRLVAMAGERFDLDGDRAAGRAPTGGDDATAGAGFHEISAVATHPDARGAGLAAGLSTLVAQGILGRGDVPFLHVVGTNAAAISVYERLGFRVRTPFRFTAYEVPPAG